MEEYSRGIMSDIFSVSILVWAMNRLYPDLIKVGQGASMIMLESLKLQSNDLFKKCGNFYINNHASSEQALQKLSAVVSTLRPPTDISEESNVPAATSSTSTKPLDLAHPSVQVSSSATVSTRSPIQSAAQPAAHVSSPATATQSKARPLAAAPPTTSASAVLQDGKASKQSAINSQALPQSADLQASPPIRKFTPRETAVPASQMARVVGFGSLGARIAFGTLWDRMKQPFVRQEQNKDTEQKTNNAAASADASRPAPRLGMSEANMERLTAGMCRMRGAALKVGQMLSIQDESLIPPQLATILDRVRDSADVMPRKQLERTLVSELGSDWRQKLKSFDFLPIAAASIGQVHRAVTLDGRDVVLKVQYPGVADSIHSDIDNLKRILQMTTMLPKGMFLEEAIEGSKEELTRECDYSCEAANQQKYQDLVRSDESLRDRIDVPDVIPELSTRRIITTAMVPGIPIDRLTYLQADQHTRNCVALLMIELCLKELFEWRFMQTDPNWSNFLYDANAGQPLGGVEGKGGKLNLIDFGATRDYDQDFVEEYMRMVQACAEKRRDDIIDSSIKLGFLTGEESKRMLQAHLEASFIIGEPFAEQGPYDFDKGNIAARASTRAAIMANIACGPIFYDMLARKKTASSG
eukprot:g68950.t1